jgi:hypothetical protein
MALHPRTAPLARHRPRRAASRRPTPCVQLAAQHLAAAIDRDHTTFDVYTDVAAGSNRFVHRAQSGNSVTVDDAYRGTVYSGATAIRDIFPPATATDWGGWFFQNGVLLPGATQPAESTGRSCRSTSRPGPCWR